MKDETQVTTTEEEMKSEMEDIQKEPLDPYEICLQHEESESKRRTEADDREMFEATCKQIKTCMREIVKLKTDKPENWASEVDGKKTRVLMLLLAVRKLGRVQKVRVKASREASSECRQTVDGVTLQLQNLLYEVAHLNKEVKRCLDFQSADKDIELVSLDRFYSEAPETVSRAEETLEDPHQQRLAQLHWELEQRRGQTELFDKLSSERKKVEEDISAQEEKLKSLRPLIDSILKATLPLQTALDLPLDAKREQNAVSEHLPVALRTLWLQASSYASAIDNLLSVSIEGDLDAAIRLQKEQAMQKENDDSDVEGDGQEDATHQSRGKKESKKTETPDSDEMQLKTLLKQHPLNVRLTVNTKEGDSITICFFYCITLEIVTTKMIISLKKQLKPSQTNVLLSGNLLNNLFAGDVGISSPNPSTVYYLQKAKISALLPKHLEQIGRPFRWAQTLCGMTFVIPQEPVEVEEKPSTSVSDMDTKEGGETVEVPLVREETPPPPRSPEVSWKESSDHMHVTIKQIRIRLRAKLALQDQLAVLEKTTTTTGIPISPEALTEHFPSKVCSQLYLWRSITWQEYEAAPYTAPFRDAKLVDDQHMLFKAEYKREEVVMKALVSIAPNYPKMAPSFALSVQWQGEHTALNNPHVKQMESEVNLHWAEMVPDAKDRLRILCFQLYRLAMCLDIFTEAKSVTADPKRKTFHKEKIFFRPSKGPDRALPFKYIPKLGVFAQR